jgi:hypothetical protein
MQILLKKNSYRDTKFRETACVFRKKFREILLNKIYLTTLYKYSTVPS